MRSHPYRRPGTDLAARRHARAEGPRRIEAYGTVDELNSHLGMLHDLAPEEHGELLGRCRARCSASDRVWP